jgi:hypothetical protein
LGPNGNSSRRHQEQQSPNAIISIAAPDPRLKMPRRINDFEPVAAHIFPHGAPET